jgi:SAM-dependent methyltransferase
VSVGFCQVNGAAGRQLVETVNRGGGTYHRLSLGDGLVIEGDFDLTKYLRHYNLPDRLDGMTVLDVGTSSGFFALECARRGGRVTAIDIWDSSCLLNSLIQLFGLDIRYVRQDVYDLDASFGKFDLVVCGSLIVHLPDPFGAVRKIRSVCADRAIIATACTTDSATNPAPLLEFTGQHAAESDYWAYWYISAAALRDMLRAAGFARVEHEEHFNLETEAGRARHFIPHVALSAYV